MPIVSTLGKLGAAIIAGAISGIIIDAFRDATVDLAKATEYGWVSVLVFEMLVLLASLDELKESKESAVLFVVLALVSLLLPVGGQLVLGFLLLIPSSLPKGFRV